MAPSAVEHEVEHLIQLKDSIIKQRITETNVVGLHNTSMPPSAVCLNGSHPHKQNGTSDGTEKIPRLSISENYKVSEQAIGTIRPVRMLCIGAGASGVNLAYQVQKNMKNTDLVIYEKSPAIGGTWYENRYPGCKCDIRE